MLPNVVRYLTLLLLIVFYVIWVVIIDVPSSDDVSVTVTHSGSVSTHTQTWSWLSQQQASALNVQMIGSLATVAFFWQADMNSNKGTALVSLFTALIFLFNWIATHSNFMIDSFYERDHSDPPTTYSLFCQDTVYVSGVGYPLTAGKSDEFCNVLRGGGGLSIIIGIIQFFFTVLAGVQVQRAPASESSMPLARYVGFTGAALAFSGQVIRAGGALRVWQRGGGSNSLGFFSDISETIALQAFGFVVALAALIHATSNDKTAAGNKPLSSKVSAVVALLVSQVVAFFSLTTMIWDARVILENTDGSTKLCGSDTNCDAYKAGLAGEVIIASGAWFVLFAALPAIKTLFADAVQGAEQPSMMGKLALGCVSLFVEALIIAYFIVCLVSATTYNSSDPLRRIAWINSSVHDTMLFACLWGIFALGALLYWHFSSKTTPAVVSLFFGSIAITCGWVILQYQFVRNWGTTSDSSVSFFGVSHSSFCPGKDKVFEIEVGDKLCQLVVGPAVLSWLFGVTEAAVTTGFVLITVMSVFRGENKSGSSGTSILQKLLFLCTLSMLVGILLWNVSLFRGIPEHIPNINIQSVYSVHLTLAVVAVISVFGAAYVALATDATALRDSLGLSILTTGAVVILGWVAIPMSSYYLKHGGGVCELDSSSDGCDSTRTGVAGLYCLVIGASAALSMQLLIALTTRGNAASPKQQTNPQQQANPQQQTNPQQTTAQEQTNP